MQELESLFLDTRLIPYEGPFQFPFSLKKLRLDGRIGIPDQLISTLLSSSLNPTSLIELSLPSSSIPPASLYSQLGSSLQSLESLEVLDLGQLSIPENDSGNLIRFTELISHLPHLKSLHTLKVKRKGKEDENHEIWIEFRKSCLEAKSVVELKFI